VRNQPFIIRINAESLPRRPDGTNATETMAQPPR